MIKHISKEWIAIISLAFFKLLIHLLTNTNYELHRDAFLYYSLGEHLDWGYLSVPPFIALLSKVSVFLFGKTVFALRFFPAIVGTISVIIIAKIVKALNGGIWAIVIAILVFILSPAFLRSNTLFQPVSFNQFFWLLSAYLIIQLLKTGNPKLWISIFTVFGIAFLNKYSITFFIISFFLALLITKHRKLFLSKYFIIGCAIGTIIILPNLMWQYNHNWPVIGHMEELQGSQLVNVSIVGFVIDQLMMNLPGLVVWMIGLITFLFFKAESKYRVIAFIYLFTLLIIIYFRGKSYYTLGLYLILFAIGGYSVDKYLKPYAKYGIIALVVVLSLPILPFSLPVYSHEKMEEYSKITAELTNRWEDGKVHNLPQDYADMIAWKELADLVINTYKELPDESKKKCSIYANEYCIAGAILFYGKDHGLPEPISFSDNFLLWAPDSINSDVFIYVNDHIGDMDWLFEKNRLAGQINNKYYRENGVKVFVCTQPKDTLSIFYARKVAESKNRYR